MAGKKVKLNVKSPSQSVKASSMPEPEDDDYQSRGDASDIMRYAQLRNNKDRFSKAMNHITRASDLGSDVKDSDFEDRPATQPRVTAKQGRRKLARNMNRR